jgi:hypothetical protein
MATMTHRWLLSVVLGLYLATVACGSKDDLDGEGVKGILEASAVNLDGEQVSITSVQLDCGVQSELWEAPSQVSQDRTTARLTSKGRELNFGDDPAIEPNYRLPHAQVRGAFSLEVEEVSDIKNGDADGSTKLVNAKASVKIPDTCFQSPLPMMGVKHGDFKEDAPVSFLFRKSDTGWRFDKLVH